MNLPIAGVEPDVRPIIDADLNDGMCLFEEGYMFYKGFGCTQSYEKAVSLFKRGAMVYNEAAYYLLGLCYRNGYGIAANRDSAKSWLTMAAKRGDKRAAVELASNTPENMDLHTSLICSPL